MTLYVDCSSNNGTPDLVAYRDAGHTELTFKATEGTGYYWPQMAALVAQWHSFGPQYRANFYHWLYGTISAAAQWAFFWSHIASVFRAGDGVMCDFEDVAPWRWVSDAQHKAVLDGFMQLAAARAPANTYTGNWYLVNLPSTVVFLRGLDVTIADYSNNPPANPYGLRYVAHQFTDRATVPGFPGPVDYNRSLVDAPSGGGVPIPIPAPVTGDDDMSKQDVADLKVWIMAYNQAKFGGTLARVAAIEDAIFTDKLAIRVAGYVTGALQLPPATGRPTKVSEQAIVTAVDQARDAILAELEPVITKLASAKDIDVDALRTAASEGAAAGVTNLTLHISAAPEGAQQ